MDNRFYVESVLHDFGTCQLTLLVSAPIVTYLHHASLDSRRLPQLPLAEAVSTKQNKTWKPGSMVESSVYRVTNLVRI